ncbi:MAG: UDP-N-acetylglucosamine pyrophosphorylase [Deltaproteobacteria bacterium]|nr:UDP-N-acetylglucosamine pyrophosphorylase [Deltaproteobacteria bacterium]
MTEVKLTDAVVQLMQKGVSIPSPWTVEIGPGVDPAKISGEGVTFHGGTRIYGAKTVISPNVTLGYEAPVTIENCQLGRSVELKGGFFKESVFLEKASAALGAHVREACILEEESSCSHTVGLKQTILFPFVTLGSLINFCDCLMAGGTSRKNHSEVGSSYIHFNYTPNQDKATASLIGDVPRGVMLRMPPIFLGGQGGLVGPARIGYGTVIAAGSVVRRDCPGGTLVREGVKESRDDFHPGFYADIQRRVFNNILYIANLLALRQWYCHVRRPFFQPEEHGPDIYEGAMEKLQMALVERVRRFEDLAERMEASIAAGEEILSGDAKEKLLAHTRQFYRAWPRMKSFFTHGDEEEAAVEKRDFFLRATEERRAREGTRYIAVIQALDDDAAAAGVAWLQAIVDAVTERALEELRRV